jgi:hypothetical protein
MKESLCLWLTLAAHLGYAFVAPGRARDAVPSRLSAEWSDFGDSFIGRGDSDDTDFSKLLQERTGSIDLTGIQTRQFSLGSDFILSNFVGEAGFEEVTDWEYYYPGEEDPNERLVVQPNPFDKST